jgi:hypothetical protein
MILGQHARCGKGRRYPSRNIAGKSQAFVRRMLALGLSMGIPCLTVTGQQPAEKGATALVQVRINTAYDDSTESLNLLKALIERGPTRQVPVLVGETLSSICVREYGFGPSDLPKTYQMLVAAILARKKLRSAEDLRPGFIVIPAIPRRAATKFDTSDSLNYVADSSFFRAKDAVSADIAASCTTCKAPKMVPGLEGIVGMGSAAEIAYTGASTGERKRIAAQFELVNYELPLAAAEDFLALGPVAAVGNMFAYPLPIRLAADYTCELDDVSKDVPFLSGAERQEIADLLTNGKRNAFVFVLDTGWPSLEAYKNSRADLYSLLGVVWKEYFNIEFPMAKANTNITSPNHPHCKCIERALRPLRDLDTAQRVRVIYLPMTQEQGGAVVIADLLQTMLLLQQINETDVTLTPAIVKDARGQAEELVTARFPKKWVGETVKSDKQLIDAVLLIGNKYAEARNTVFIANESWTTKHAQYSVTYPSPLFGSVIAATGNADENVNAKLLDFAQRASNNRDTVAVLNMQGNGIVCDSGFIDKGDIDIAQAVGFDGHITDDFCATSFAAPRVAWFLAAGEATRTSELNQRHWGIDLHDCLSMLRNTSDQGFTRLLFRPAKFLAAQSSGTCKNVSATPPPPH